jgi:VWFA-related protein
VVTSRTLFCQPISRTATILSEYRDYNGACSTARPPSSFSHSRSTLASVVSSSNGAPLLPTSRAAAIGLPDQGPSPPPRIWFPGGGTVGINGKRVNMEREARLYDAISVGTNRYLKGEVGRKAVVIVALSGDSRSESTMEEALQALLENDVIAYVIQIYDAPGRDNCDVRHIFEKGSLKQLAEATGGRMLEVRGIDKLEAALDEISDELHHQYSLGYYPENKNLAGKFRRIQISTREKGYKVYARKGYYAYPSEANVATRQ